MSDPESSITGRLHGLLIAAGFEVISERRFQSFGDALVVLRRGSLEVLLGRDRGQEFITVRVPGTDLDYQVAIWESCLDGAPPSPHVRDLDKDVEVIIRRSADMERIATGGEVLLECLRAAGLRRFQMRREQGLIDRPS